MSKLKIPVTLTSGINQPIVEASEVKDVTFNKNQSKINEDTSRAIGNINNLVVGEDNLVDAINVNSNSIVTLDETKANKVDVQTALDLKADKTDLNSYVNDASYDSNTKRINFKHNSTVLAFIDATDFIKDGMVSNVTIENGYLVITFNTDSGKEPIRLALTDIFNPNNYYTKGVIDNKLGSLEFLTGNDNVTDAVNTTIRNLTTGLDNLNTIKANKTEVDEELAKKANTDGWYPRMVAGAAESVIGKDISVDEATDYVVQGATGIAKVNEVMGRSEKWNQLVDTAHFSLPTIAGLTLTDNGDGSITVDGTPSQEKWIAFTLSGYRPALIAGHKYLLKGCPKNGSNSTYSLWETNGRLLRDNGGGSITSVATSSPICAVTILIRANIVCDNLVYRPRLFDLTDIYGAGNEPTTVEQFEADVLAKYGKTLDEYFEYDAGSIKNANVEKLDITGFNQWDEEWELGKWNPNTGAKLSTNNEIRSSNYIEVLPSTTYSFRDGQTIRSYCNLLFYDANKVYLGRSGGFVANVQTFTTPASCHYITFYEDSGYGTTYNHNICINISDATKNGTYEPYKHTELPVNIKTITGKVNGEGESVTIFPDGMRGVGTAYDRLIVDEDGWARRTIVRMANRAYQEGDESNTSVLTDGTTTIYALETPIEYVLDTPILMTFNAYNGGVIRQVKSDMELATRLNITFALNVQGFINNANKDYISAASMQAFLTKLSSAKGGTWGMTYNSTTQQYEFTYNQ